MRATCERRLKPDLGDPLSTRPGRLIERPTGVGYHSIRVPTPLSRPAQSYFPVGKSRVWIVPPGPVCPQPQSWDRLAFTITLLIDRVLGDRCLLGHAPTKQAQP
jgi:hypothetical protein